MIRVVPPAALMKPTPEPACDPGTNGELLNCLWDTRAALKRANADKAAILKAVQ